MNKFKEGLRLDLTFYKNNFFRLKQRLKFKKVANSLRFFLFLKYIETTVSMY